MEDNSPQPLSTPSLGHCEHIRPAKPQGRKRKRVSVACRACRIRKSRCNGGQPCSSCEDMETQCQYEQPPTRPVTLTDNGTGDPSDANAMLERRLQMIEQKLHVLGSASNGSPEVQTATSPAVPAREQLQSAAGVKRMSDPDDGVDGMGAVPLKDGADEDEYFGSSSNVAFLRFIISSIGNLVNPVATPTRSMTGISADMEQSCDEGFNAFLKRPTELAISSDGWRGSPVEPFALPSQVEADSLLHLYFTTVNLMIPCIHEDSFREMYMKMQRDGLGGLRRSWLGVLNVIFAIATNVTAPTSPTHERAEKSKIYFERAVELIRSSILGRLSLEMVQLFLLMEAYLEGTTSASMTWTFHGLAVKGAYQLGLHIVSSKNLSPLDQEVRRRLWYWCVMNDRLLSVRYGRPPLIPLSHVRLGTSLHLPFSNVSSATTTSSLVFFDAIMSITHIMGDALERLYDQNLGFRNSLSMSEALNQVSELCWKLAQWQDNLPFSLRLINSKDTLNDVPLTIGTTRFRVLLSLRYLGARILILRPILSQFLDLRGVTASNEHQSEWLRNSGAVLLADLVRTCSDVFQISKNILAGSKDHQNLLGAWWFSCYYTFNASLAILGVLLVKRTTAYKGETSTYSVTELQTLLDIAMDILRGLDKGNKTLMKCRDTLGRLFHKVFDSDGNMARIMPESLSLSPSSAWTWQLIDPGLFSLEASLSLAVGVGAFDAEPGSQIPGTAESWDLDREWHR